jgi:hypothetical protein
VKGHDFQKKNQGMLRTYECKVTLTVRDYEYVSNEVEQSVNG